jgi:beta-glucosidase
MPERLREDFGEHFTWGVATSALQSEGAHDKYGRTPSVWEEFARRPFKISRRDRPEKGIDFFHRYKEDIQLARFLGFDAFRFSISWSRLMGTADGKINPQGVSFYNRVIDECLIQGIEPWITVYHWDLPVVLEKLGGWPHRNILDHFGLYVSACTAHFGDRVKNWIVMNEPMGFTALGYLLGIHAPGRRSLKGFIKAVHHAALCQAAGGRMLKEQVQGSNIGTALSFAVVESVDQSPRNMAAASRLDVVLNRLFLEPLLGMGYPLSDFPLLNRIQDYIVPGDIEALTFNFDFIGVQYYFRYVVRHNPLIPLIKASLMPAHKRGVPMTSMNFESFPDGIYTILKRFAKYPSMPDIYITESGACFKDTLVGDRIHDPLRIEYHQATLRAIKQARDEGANIRGFFAWTLADNFEWSYGYSARFGLVYVDRISLNRMIKDSGYWYQQQLSFRG